MGIQINGNTDTVTSTSAGGSVKVTPLTASTGLNVGTGASISSPATNVLTLGTNNSERVRINSSGTVGVNTTAVDSQLEVHSATSKINTVTIKTSAGASGYAGLAFMAGQTTAGREKAAIYFQETNGGAHYTGDIVFALNSTSGSAVQVSTSDEKMRIDSSGRVTAPYQPCFLAGRSGTQTYSAGNTIVFNLEIFDQSNSYNNSTGVFTAPVTGRYLFLVTVLVQSSATGYEYDLLLSTSNRDYVGCPGRTEYQLGTSWGDGYIAHGVQQIADMDAGDTCSLRYTTFGGGSIYGGGGGGSWDGWTRFSGHLLC